MIEDPILLNHNRQLQRRRANANLRATALSWATMVIVSVLAAAYVSYSTNDNDGYDELDLRMLQSEQHQHHVHKPVYDENHKSLFPLSTSDRIGFSLAIFGLMIAAGGGIGGGGILVPIYILVMGFSPKHGKRNKIIQDRNLEQVCGGTSAGILEIFNGMANSGR